MPQDPTSSYFSAQPARFRGSSYPSFSGGTVDQSGNIVSTPSVTNVGSATPSVPKPTDDQISAGGTVAVNQAGNPDTKSGLSNQFPADKGPTTLGGKLALTAGGAVLPAAGSVFGRAAGDAIQEGFSPLSAGANAITNKVGSIANDVGGFLGFGGGTTAAATTGGDAASLAANSGIATTGSDSLVGGATGSLGGGTLAGSALGGFGAGIGTFGIDLLSGKNLADSARDAAATGIGAAIGTYAIPIPVVGTVIGGLLGGFVGNMFGPKPSVGPNGQTDFLANIDSGHLDIGPSGADNGADVNVTKNAATTTQKAINDYLDANNLAVIGKDPNYVGSDGWKRMLSIGQGSAYEGPARSAQQVWEYLVKNKMVGPKTTPNGVGNPAPGTNQQTESLKGLSAQYPASSNDQAASVAKVNQKPLGQLYI